MARVTRPLPPKQLMRRVGWVVGDERPADVFADRGLEQWRLIKSLLGDGYDLRGRRALDFGCGVGRILRPALIEDPGCELWGCDIDQPSIDWLGAECPELSLRRNGAWPPLDVPSGHFDLIWAFSVFTHLTDAWSAWMLELHRLLKPGGILVATVFGPGHVNFVDEPVSEEIIGMNVLYPYASWDTGGPLILHSRWWVEAHWGRAFEILDFRVGRQDGAPPLYGQSAVVMRRRDVALTVADLERPEPDESREWAAIRQDASAHRRELIRLRKELDIVYNGHSWRLTAPLRALAERRRRPGGRVH
jgi:SAM-dependent methyltransferase